MRLVLVCGSPTPPGRLARALAAASAAASVPGWDCDTLAPVAPERGLATAWPADALDRVAAADAVLFGTPVFRGSLPGLLKSLLDALPGEALRDTPVGVVSVSAAPQHAYGAERHLREVLGWFGALVAPTGCALTEAELAGDPGPETRAELADLVTTLQLLADRLGGARLGPDPLAARTRRPAPAHSTTNPEETP